MATWIDTLAAQPEGATELGTTTAKRLLSDWEQLPPTVKDAARARFLRAQLLAMAGDVGAAADALPVDASELPPSVQEQALRQRAIWLVQAERCEDARPWLQRWAETEPEMRARLGQCALLVGKYAKARELLGRIPPNRAGIDPFVLKLGLAEALAHTDAKDQAVSILRSLVSTRPEHGLADRALVALRALGISELDTDMRLQRAVRWTQIGRAEQALEELAPLKLRPNDANWARYLHVRGMALFRTRKHYAEAARVLASAVKVKSSSTVIEDGFHAARALSRAGDDRAAVRAYQAFAQRHRGHPRAIEAEFLAAWLVLRQGDPKGQQWMKRFVAGAGGKASPALAGDGLWQLAFSAFEARRYREAEQRFLEYAKLPGEMVQSRGLYWAGRAALAAKKRGQAIRYFQEARDSEPLHWYALLAEQRLKALNVPLSPPYPLGAALAAHADTPVSEAARLDGVELPDDVQFYHGLGLRRLALEALERQEAAVAKAPGAEGVRTLVMAYHALGEFRRPFVLVASKVADAIRKGPGPQTRWIWDASYARPYSTEIERAAEGSDVPVELLYAVMRKESAFQPDVVSYADAIGLMQLIPPTARTLSEAVGKPFDREHLYDPAWNIQLGARLLGQLTKAFAGQVPLAVAAYNAGGFRIRSWVDRKESMDLDVFVERIPIEQTRNYVRRVVTSWARYQYLTDPTADPAGLLPTRVKGGALELAEGL